MNDENAPLEALEALPNCDALRANATAELAALKRRDAELSARIKALEGGGALLGVLQLGALVGRDREARRASEQPRGEGAGEAPLVGQRLDCHGRARAWFCASSAESRFVNWMTMDSSSVTRRIS